MLRGVFVCRNYEPAGVGAETSCTSEIDWPTGSRPAKSAAFTVASPG